MKSSYLRLGLVTISVILFTSALGFFALFYWDNTQFEDEEYQIYIKTGWNFEALQEVLNPQLKSPLLFRWTAQLKGYDQRIRSGYYNIPSGLSSNDLINHLRRQSQALTITFNNQERLENLAGRLATVLEADSLSFLIAMRNPAFLSAKGFTDTTALAMYLPNSYSFFWDVRPEDFCERMYSEYERFWTTERKRLAEEQGLTPLEVMTLASIVHKESVKADERPAVAGVYLNRLKRRMKLQADPTVIYALKAHYQNFDTIIKRVLYKDLKLTSPYNTYRIKGLPPGPIAMPDVSAIEAVLSPQKHRFLYFVANPDKPGYHLFATNLRQHNRNKQKYVRWINKQKLFR